MKLELAKCARVILPVIAVLLASPWLGAASEQERPKARRPAVGEDRKAVPAPAQGPAFELAGLAKLEGDASFALLQEPELTMGAPVLVRLGQSIGSYRLVAVEEDRVRLESATGVVTVLLGGAKDNSAAPRPRPEGETRGDQSVPAESPPAPVAVAPSEPAPVRDPEAERVLNSIKNALGIGTRRP